LLPKLIQEKIPIQKWGGQAPPEIKVGGLGPCGLPRSATYGWCTVLEWMFSGSKRKNYLLSNTWWYRL